ncbi:uncharacterized protein LOC131849751 [Achroia grisella]|uniref:uncharacterized protein LOC131849751 n=1 Tax=Achroia grisella TaxID=688607 RepID=UPI0027D28EFC|nr:uncharacterized protein LOC131849751 [Achroia grisella]
MDFSGEIEGTKKCFNCDYQLYDNVNINYDEATSMIALWNKFQILVYENRNLESTAKIFMPDFQIHDLIVCNNYIVCLDNNHCVHTTSLKFKSPAQKRFKTSFQLKVQDVAVFSRYHEDYVLCLQYEAECYYLCLHKLNASFQLEKKVAIKHSGPWPLPKPNLNKCLLTSFHIEPVHFDSIKKIYEVSETVSIDCSILLMSFDNLTVYSCLFSNKMIEEQVTIVKLYTCPSEICNIEIIAKENLSLLISLKMGTLITLELQDTSMEPKIIHLNTAIYKCLRQNDNIIYTDGVTMWSSTNTYSDVNINLRQFIVNQVKDFAKCGDYLICTSYSKLIYVIPLDDDTSYIKASNDPYTPAEKLLNNSEYLYKILEEIEMNNDVIKKVQEESNYITTLSLSNRQDLVEDIIQHSIVVYENYQEAIQDNKDLILADNMWEYFKADTLLLVVKITTTTLQHMFANMISNLLNDLKIHVTLSNDLKILKTTSVKLKGALRKVNILIGLNNKNIKIFEVNALIKIIVKIPGAHDRKQFLWATLYKKEFPLNSEHFIKTANDFTNICHMNESGDTIEKLIYKVAYNQHKHIFQFIDVSKTKTNSSNWSLYLKLPVNYREILKNDSYCRKHLSVSRANFLVEEYTREEFLDSKSDVSFDIGDEKVKLEIINDDPTWPVLKITSVNIKLSFNIRNFFSNIIYNNFKSHRTEREYVIYNLYTVTETLQRDLKACIMENYSLERFRPLAEQFQRSIIGALPI